MPSPLYVFIVAQVSVFVSSVQYTCDDPTRFVLFGKYCYNIQPGATSSIFEDQENNCENMFSYLAGFETLDEQNQLVDYIHDVIGDKFKLFYIGLICDTVNKQWKWTDPYIAFNPADATFENSKFDPRLCYNDDEDIHFQLTPDSKWHEIMINDLDKTSDFLVCQRKAKEVSSTDATPVPYDDTALVIGLGITCMILVVVIIFMCIKFRKKIAVLMAQAMQASRERFRDDPDIEKAAAEPKDEWEIGRQFLDINYSMKLGTGAFGVVFLGQIDVEYLPKSSERSILQLSSLKRNNGRVAVKMLHESADRLAEVDFLQEIEMMKCIGYHERLVNIIASVTESQPHLLITEYCPNGDFLLSYLKQRREYMLELPPNPDYSLVNRSLLITQEQQLQFAVQIAYGLEFLSGRGFVHRDIAARNILVDERNGCKIGDFGLCRRVQQEQELYLSRGGLLPIKWMSPEALRRYEMSTASDVWSYGILLFEIITLGGSPYPNWEPSEILPRLEAGERMERPDNCPDAVFDAMTECWCEHPMKRPDFTTLRSRLAKALEESPSEYYLQLDSQRDYYLVPRSKDLPVPEEEFIRII